MPTRFIKQGIDIGSGLFFLISIFLTGYAAYELTVPIVLIAYHVLRIYTYRVSTELVLLLLFGVTYPAMWLASVVMKVQIHYLVDNIEPRHIGMALAAQGLFLCCMFLVLGTRSPHTIAQSVRRDNAFIYWLSITAILGALAVAAYQTRGSSIFARAYDFEESESSVLFEYVLIPILLAFAYSGKTKLKRYVLLGSCLLAIAAPVIVGRRLPAMMVALAVILLFFRIRGLWKIVGIVAAGFVALSSLALFRSGLNMTSISQLIFNVSDAGAMRNNQGGVVYVAGVYMKLVEDGVFNIWFGLRSFGNALLAIFLPSSMVDDSAYINKAAMEYINIPGNGGLPGVQFYVWGGLVGLIAAGAGLGWLLLKSRTSAMASIYVTLAFVTFPRWMAYNVNILFKMGTLLVIAWIICALIHRYLARHYPAMFPEQVTDPEAKVDAMSSAETVADIGRNAAAPFTRRGQRDLMRRRSRRQPNEDEQ